MKTYFYLIFILLLSTTIQAQHTEKPDIECFPIPRTLKRSFELLNKTMCDDEIYLIKTLQEDSIYYHPKFMLKADFWHAWKIYDGSRLTRYFNRKGLFRPAEIYETILISFHRYLNNKPIKLEEQIARYKLEHAREYEEYLQKLQKDTINGIYIPKNLEDSFIQLDKLLSDEDKQTIQQLNNRKETIQFHHSLGMWLRNNWGLWSGSRLQKYMLDRGINHPDEMSAIILEFYYDWLNRQNDEWKKFEAKQ